MNLPRTRPDTSDMPADELTERVERLEEYFAELLKLLAIHAGISFDSDPGSLSPPPWVRDRFATTNHALRSEWNRERTREAEQDA